MKQFDHLLMTIAVGLLLSIGIDGVMERGQSSSAVGSPGQAAGPIVEKAPIEYFFRSYFNVITDVQFTETRTVHLGRLATNIRAHYVEGEIRFVGYAQDRDRIRTVGLLPTPQIPLTQLVPTISLHNRVTPFIIMDILRHDFGAPHLYGIVLVHGPGRGLFQRTWREWDVPKAALVLFNSMQTAAGRRLP